ncbi:hypothetical protein EVG20_g1883 [Dentipellis fragilis]|uniref:Uncharacterized protein n=1 Tax=Dentipellis fragilis TaxID=205917 RepID=A0A4Y9ZAT8_9AGAM|nr:hypothetical protein EVG20_g1883 [Dentipellis fragilis]
MPLSLDRAILGAIFAESVMYGICLTLSAVTVLVVLRARTESTLAWKPLLLALVLMTILATVHVILSFILVDEYFILKHDVYGNRLIRWGQGNSILIAKDVIFLSQILLGDTVYMWRCYMVWGKKKRVLVFPSLVMIAGLTCSVQYTRLIHSSNGVSNGYSGWEKAFLVAIVWRIWKVNKSRNLPTLAVMVEAGIPYTANLIAFVVSYMAYTEGMNIALDIITPHVPIVFCFIILQIKYHQSSDASYAVTSTPEISWDDAAHTLRRQAGRKGHIDTPAASEPPTFDIRPVEVEISTSTEYCFDLTDKEIFADPRKVVTPSSIDDKFTSNV